MAQRVEKPQEEYQVQDALTEAVRLLKEEFGEADQSAAVQLASILYTTRERDRFLHRERHEPGEPPYT